MISVEFVEAYNVAKVSFTATVSARFLHASVPAIANIPEAMNINSIPDVSSDFPNNLAIHAIRTVIRGIKPSSPETVKNRIFIGSQLIALPAFLLILF
jgi:hypothetical protein